MHADDITHEPGAIHDIGSAIHNRLNQTWIFTRIVFQVRILDDHYVTGNVAKSRAQGGPLASVALMVHDAQVRLPLQRSQHVPGAISAAIIDNDNLFPQGDSAHTANDFLNRCLFIVDWHSNGEFEIY